MSKTWFITGTSRGFGRVFAEAALGRGDRVVATARDTTALAPLVEAYGPSVLPVPLDVTDRRAIDDAVTRAHDTFGGIDILVNNAGYGLFGMVEELSEDQLRQQMETNFFGAAWLTQAVLPGMREQSGGHIVQISSIGGVGAFPGLGGYHASKWALEGFSESLSAEVAGFGINVTIVEPGGFATDWATSSAHHAEPNEAYTGLREAMYGGNDGAAFEFGAPDAAGRALLEIVDAEKPPLRVLFGKDPIDDVKRIYAERLATWDAWRNVALLAQGPSAAAE